MAGNTMDKCRDCRWFEYKEDPQNTDRYIDGICNKLFPVGYIGRKPPHKAWSNHIHCFRFDPKDNFEQTEMDIEEE